ncbi:ATP-binding cassette domain-containing protein [uncultured Stenotrophomonas sp.]|uniref:sulfate/molybdate ABC transporter ATP-binding protein n=1 Tax=uncultured Stenotrophomonas sp. TaxID=165438 RepID=UPI0028E6F29E|nr:ATP-binding cassette domain-containing protein [uncultured Stenotrophomonas sp.]
MWLDLDIRRRFSAPGQQFELDVQLQCTQRQVVLFGPSGAGKSLTLKAIAGLLRPEAGHVRLGGMNLFDAGQGVNLPPQQRRLGYLFQDYALFPHLTVRQNIAFGLRRGWFNPSRREQDPEVERWMAALRIEHLAQMLPAQLSGGQRQRTALARSLVTRPQALLLDEPFAALDHDLRAHLRQELQEVLDATDVPLLLISHDPADVAMFGQQVVELADGKVTRP